MEKSARKALPSRQSRGTRINKLIGEEAEADDAFWNQDAWNEDAEDSDYSSEDEEEDVVDSDFDEEEAPDEDVHGDEDEEGGKGRRKRGRPTKEEAAMRRVYQEPERGAKRTRRSGDAATAASGSVDGVVVNAGQEGASDTPRSAAAVVSYEVPKLRQSTAQKSSQSSDLRRKIFEEAAKLAAKVKKPQVVKTRLTQEQLLIEAVRTELENTQSLNRLERLEEEKKAENVIAPKVPFTGMIVRYHSRIGAPKTITFLNTDRFPKIFDQQQPRKRERLAPREERVEDDDDDDDDEDGEEEEEEDDENETEEQVTAEEDDGHDTTESK